MKKETYIAKSKIAWYFKLYAFTLSCLCIPLIIHLLQGNDFILFLFAFFFALFLTFILLTLARSKIEIYDDLVLVNTIFRRYTVYFSRVHDVKNNGFKTGNTYLFRDFDKKILFVIADFTFSNASYLKDTILERIQLYRNDSA